MTEQTKRWRGFTHEELYRLLHEGPGAGASADPGRRWAELSSTLADVGQDLATALDSSGSGWVGRAAGRAYERLAPLAAWAITAGETAAGMRVAVENQGDYVAKARADMPAPENAPQQQPDPTIAPAIQVLGAQNDPEPIEAARSSGEQRAFEVMAGAGGAGTPMSTAGAAPTPADKLALRRFGTEALGSSQWFADTADSAPSRTVSGRRRDLSATEQVTESVTVDGEDHSCRRT